MNIKAAMSLLLLSVGLMGVAGVSAASKQEVPANDSQQLIVQQFIEQFRATCQTKGLVAIPVIQGGTLYIEVYECTFLNFQEYFEEDAPPTDKKGKEYEI